MSGVELNVMFDSVKRAEIAVTLSGAAIFLLSNMS
jgi:hypothetical protein